MMLALDKNYHQASSLLAPVQIGRAAPVDATEWNDFVQRHPAGSFFHLYGWSEVIANTYGYEPVYLLARRGGVITGLLPMIDVKASLLGRSLVSTAFTVGGGIIGDDRESILALADRAQQIGEERGVQHIELRGEDPILDDWITKADTYATFRGDLIADEDRHLNSIPRKRRAELRKALSSAQAGALRLRLQTDPDRFYGLYARTLRDHGTPVFPKKFLAELLAQFGEHIDFAFVDHEGAASAGLLSFRFKNAIMPYYAGAVRSARQSRSLEYLYWSLMRRSIDHGLTTFDFGRSKIDSGPYHFKKHWGFDPKPLSYQIKLIRAVSAPNVNPNNPKFRYFIQAWRRLPLGVANRVGPLLAPNFP